MLFAFFIVPLWLACILAIPYKLVRNSRKRLRFFVRTWVVFFALEMIVILFLPLEQMEYLGLQKEGGFWYWLVFTKGFTKLIGGLLHGYGKDFWILLLAPITPALVAFWIGYREEQASVNK